MRPFTYTKPTSAADAVRAIAAAGPGARFLAGGTTLYDLMKLNVETPSSIIDVNSFTDLSGFDTSGSSELVFGALARMSDVAADTVLVHDYPALAEFAVAALPRRNFATWQASAATSSSAPDAPIFAGLSRSPATSARLEAAAPPGTA